MPKPADSKKWASFPGVAMSVVLRVIQKQLVLVAAAALLVPQSPGKMPWNAPYLGSAALCFLTERRRLDGDVLWIMDFLPPLKTRCFS